MVKDRIVSLSWGMSALVLITTLALPALGNESADAGGSEKSISKKAARRAQAKLSWMDNYPKAMERAKAEKKMLLVHFYRPADQSRTDAGSAADSVVNVERSLVEPGISERLRQYVLVKVPVDTTISVKGESVRLLQHGAFSELRNGPGVAVVDFAHENESYYGFVVSVLPFTPGKYYRFHSNHLELLVHLPAGTLTQRSMILAVRMHPERPASTAGENDPILLSEASSHSNYQAQVRVQGHHHWESRFQRILGKLLGRGRSGTPVEVVAESWPNQDLMDSCVDCVASWRHSEGHWSAVSAKQASYGYDIRKSDNGIWYATGIFRQAGN